MHNAYSQIDAAGRDHSQFIAAAVVQWRVLSACSKYHLLVEDAVYEKACGFGDCHAAKSWLSFDGLDRQWRRAGCDWPSVSWYQFGPCCNSDLTLEAAFIGKRHCFTWLPDLNCIVLYRNKLLLIYYFHFHIPTRWILLLQKSWSWAGLLFSLNNIFFLTN